MEGIPNGPLEIPKTEKKLPFIISSIEKLEEKSRFGISKLTQLF